MQQTILIESLNRITLSISVFLSVSLSYMYVFAHAHVCKLCKEKLFDCKFYEVQNWFAQIIKLIFIDLADQKNENSYIKRESS